MALRSAICDYTESKRATRGVEAANRRRTAMSDETETFGSQLCNELKRLNRFDMITNRLHYDAIQQLKQSDRQQTLKLFQGSHYEFLQLIKTRSPAEIADYLVEQQKQASAAVAAIMMMNIVICGS
jgi:hypothetical protein